MSRTYGDTRNCAGCRYWSEMIAGCEGGGSVKAMCLNASSPLKGKMTPGFAKCENWASGHFGAIDEPGQDPSIYDAEAA